ncbi:MAG: hypothetical protein QNJ77_00430 [Acidimicrobiia bacterium]|nr:hypothetical protein [Acidimicrobiia bacterium]
METVIGGIVVVVVLAAVVVFLLLRDRQRTNAGDAATGEVTGLAGRRPSADFHIVSNEALVTFDVPLPLEGADPVLRDLLLHQAVELMRDRKARGQPLEGIEVIRVFGMRAGSRGEVGVLELTELNELPEVAVPIPLARTVAEDHDPLRSIGETDIKKIMPLSDATALDQLAPIGSDIRLTAGIAAGLRSMGIDPDAMSVDELGLGLLELAGYQVSGRGDGTYVASGGGSSSFVYFVVHDAGSYPELEASAMSEFLVGYAGARTDRGLLITDKYGPYAVYEKERSNPNCRFITRERLQAFVDSIALS